MRAVILAAALAATPAAAQQVCVPTDQAMIELFSGYGELPRVAMLVATGNVVQVLVNPETQTWTMLITDGEQSCVVASGQGFLVVEPETPAKGEPA